MKTCLECDEPVDYRGGDFLCTAHALERCRAIAAGTISGDKSEALADIARLEGTEQQEFLRAA